MFIFSLLLTGYLMELNNIFYLLIIVIIFQMFFLQLKKLNIKNTVSCLKIFKSNNLLGLLVLLSLAIGKI